MALWRFRSFISEFEMIDKWKYPVVTWSGELPFSALKYAQIHHPGEIHCCFQMTFCFSSFLFSGPVSWVAQKSPVLVIMFYCCHLNFLTKCHIFISNWALQIMYRILSSWWNICDRHSICGYSLHSSGLYQEMFTSSTTSMKLFFPTSSSMLSAAVTFSVVRFCTSNTGFQSFLEIISSLCSHDTWVLPLLDLMFSFFVVFFVLLCQFFLLVLPHIWKYLPRLNNQQLNCSSASLFTPI